MKISCKNLDEFFDNLHDANVFLSTVWFSISANPLPGKPVEEILFQASAVVDLGEGQGQYLLEVGQFCGKDYNDATQEKNGSQEAKRLQGELEAFVRSKGWSVKPGVADV